VAGLPDARGPLSLLVAEVELGVGEVGGGDDAAGAAPLDDALVVGCVGGGGGGVAGVVDPEDAGAHGFALGLVAEDGLPAGVAADGELADLAAGEGGADGVD